MTMPEVAPRVHTIDIETLLAQAHRAKDLLTGARALLSGTTAPMVPTGCNLVLEARAQLEGIVYALESLAAVEAEAKRATRAHQLESARVHTALQTGGLR